jgi:hypothetical protein
MRASGVGVSGPRFLRREARETPRQSPCHPALA